MIFQINLIKIIILIIQNKIKTYKMIYKTMIILMIVNKTKELIINNYNNKIIIYIKVKVQIKTWAILIII